uniref:Glutathione S-transferase omega n=1 Tax=Maylandia zebra TaxID=106582 RepID=A0A3P9BNL0_9CICH
HSSFPKILGCSAAPGPVPKGYIKVYSMRFCLFAQRARLVLKAKGIKHEIINVHLADKPEWYLIKNPFGIVLTLETPLDEGYPEKQLLPSSPFAKAKNDAGVFFQSRIGYFYRISSGRKNGQDVSGLEAELKEKLSKLNEDLVKKKIKFFGGDSITMFDYMMWPWFERLEVFDCLDGTPEMKMWTERMLEDPAVKATIHSVDAHKAFFKSFVDGKPDYDYGL